MRCVSLRMTTLALLAAVAIGGSTTTASASDAGLRTLVSQQRAAEKRTTAKVSAAGDRFGTPSSFPQYRRGFGAYLRSVRRIFLQEARTEDRYRAKFLAEAPETDDATRGRSLILLGLRDGSKALRIIARRIPALQRKVRRVRSEAGVRRFGRALDRAFTVQGSSSESRLKRGRTLIRNAPAVPVPTPAPPTVPEPTPAPPATTTPAPPSLIPGLL